MLLGTIAVLSAVLAAVTCIAAVAILLWQNTKPHDPAKLYVNQVAAEEKKEE